MLMLLLLPLLSMTSKHNELKKKCLFCVYISEQAAHLDHQFCIMKHEPSTTEREREEEMYEQAFRQQVHF
jgi:hypothetical protein